jgi:two-component system phosphate regulon response regulator PhoB
MATVLIVDDEEGFRHILQIVLRRSGYATMEAGNAREALLVLEGAIPELIILDDMMPGMSGSELCVQLKRDRRTATVPVLMYSANTRLGDPAYVASLGAEGVLMKPSSPRELVAVVNQFLQPAAL